ncbi:MAG: hypothetical protein WCY34_01980 [Candidatus Omnitrophota bacterium]
MALFGFLKTIFNPKKPASGKLSGRKTKVRKKPRVKAKVKKKKKDEKRPSRPGKKKPAGKKAFKKPLKKKPKKAATGVSKRTAKPDAKKKKNPVRRKPPSNRKASGALKNKEKEIGFVTHYFGKISVGIIKLKASLSAGDKIHIKGANDDFRQIVSSMQIDHKDVSKASKGDEIGVKVLRPVHENDKVYLAEA